MDINILKGLIGTTYKNFDMVSFDNRLKVQKFIYIMQNIFKIDLGYEFKWYMFGPYCTELAKEGFIIEDFKNPQKISFTEKEEAKSFGNFLSFINKNKDDVFWLEVVSSIHLLKNIYPEKADKEIIKEVMNKREELKEKEKDITIIFGDLKKLGILK